MLAPEFLPVWGGVGTYIIGLLKHLPSDIEVHVVAPKRESFDKGKKSVVKDYNSYFGDNIHVHLISEAKDTFFYNASFQFACFNYVPKLIKEENIDLIHSHTAHMPDLQLMLRRLGTPVITTVHTTICSQRFGTHYSKKGVTQFERSEKATYLMYPTLRIAEKIYFARKRHYISPSQWMKKWLEYTGHANGNVTVIPNSVDISDYKPMGSIECKKLWSDNSNRKIILYVGRLLAMKGIDTLIDAIPKIISETRNDNLLFIFAGPGDNTSYIKKVQDLDIQRHCLFMGQLSRETTIQFMKAAELVVVPSFLENCPYVVLESMACGTPVIASNVGGIPEIIDDNLNGMLVNPGIPEVLANAVVNLITDRAMRKLMSQRAKEKIAKNFSWTVNMDKYITAYSDALS